MQGGAYLFIPNRGQVHYIAVVCDMGPQHYTARFFSVQGMRIPIVRIPVCIAKEFGSFHPLVAVLDARRLALERMQVEPATEVLLSSDASSGGPHTGGETGIGYLRHNGHPVNEDLPVELGLER